MRSRSPARYGRKPSRLFDGTAQDDGSSRVSLRRNSDFIEGWFRVLRSHKAFPSRAGNFRFPVHFPDVIHSRRAAPAREPPRSVKRRRA
jgi:hypothetical protein